MLCCPDSHHLLTNSDTLHLLPHELKQLLFLSITHSLFPRDILSCFQHNFVASLDRLIILIHPPYESGRIKHTHTRASILKSTIELVPTLLSSWRKLCLNQVLRSTSSLSMNSIFNSRSRMLTCIRTVDLAKVPDKLICKNCQNFLLNGFKTACCEGSICESCK